MGGQEVMQETPQEYRERILSYVRTDEAPLELQKATLRKLEPLLEGVPASRVRERPAPGKWSIGEIVSHLADTELVGGYRIRMILGAPGTTIQAFDQDAWVVALHYDKRDVRESLDQFRVLREANLSLLRTITPEQWRQYGMHAERGQETIETIVRMFAGHDVNHLRQIERLLAAKK
jgi:DinB superfamily